MKALTACWILLWASLSCVAQAQETRASDDRVEKLLKQAGLNYTIDDDGDFKLEEATEDDRTQLVWINSNTEKFGSLEIREIWSIGMISDRPLSQDVANRLLSDNAKTKLGAWRVEKMGDRYAAIFAAQIGADTDEESLIFALLAVVLTADKTEKDLTDKDDF